MIIHLFIVWMVRGNARVMLEAFGRDKKSRGHGKSLSLEKKVPRISVDAGCRRYGNLVNVPD
jgi:hypothetical protein